MSVLMVSIPTLSEARLRHAGLPAFFRPQELRSAQIDYEELRRLTRAGTIERVARGLYRFADAEPTENYSLAAVCARVPRSVVCLLSALRVHEIGTRVTASVWLAIPNKARPPRIHDTKIRLVRFSGAAWTYGVAHTSFEGVPALITNPARTIVDCFRFEHRIGREAAREALREALRQKKVTTDALYQALDVLPSRKLSAVLEAMA